MLSDLIQQSFTVLYTRAIA